MDRRSAGWSRPVVVGFTALLVIVYVGATAQLAWERSHFIADDLIGFWFATHKPFTTYVAMPIDIHFAPLHRLTTYLIRVLAPMNFRVGLGVLVTFHLAAVALLYATLERLLKTSWNWVFVGLYATHVYLPPLFFWWTAALHRLPCIAFSLAAIYAYVRYRDGGRWPWVVVLCAAELCAFGYFIKAILVPVMLLGIEVCAWRETEPGARRRNAAALGFSVLVAVAYVAVWFVRSSVWAHALAPSARYLENGMRWSWMILLESTLGFGPGGALRFVAALGVWLVAFGFTIRRSVANAMPWLWLVGVVSVSIFMTLAPLSRYVLLLGNPYGVTHRYYFELMLPLVLFLALAFGPKTRSTGTESVRSINEQKTLEAGVAAVLALSAVHAFLAARALTALPPYTTYAKQRQLIRHFRSDLRILQERGEHVVLVDGEVPVFTLGWGTEWRRQSRLLEAMGIPIPFDPHGNYRIAEDGHIVPMPK